jgi:hypothetical protein
VKVLLYAFPRRFRERYREEILDLVERSDTPLRDAANLLVSGLSQRVRLPVALAGGVAAVLVGSALAGWPVAVGGCSLLGSLLIACAPALTGSLAARRARA